MISLQQKELLGILVCEHEVTPAHLSFPKAVGQFAVNILTPYLGTYEPLLDFFPSFSSNQCIQRQGIFLSLQKCCESNLNQIPLSFRHNKGK